MSPFDMAEFAALNSFIIANLPGLSYMLPTEVRDLPMFSPVQGIIFATDAGLKKISAPTTVIIVMNIFICFVPCCSISCCTVSNREKLEKFREP
jgi:hypothetical protein